MENLHGGVKWSCVAAVGGAVSLFAWSLSVPLTGGATLLAATQGAGITLATIAAIGDCRYY